MGEATRILGSWQGDVVDIWTKWNEMIEKQLKTGLVCVLVAYYC